MGRFGDAVSAMTHFGDIICVSGGSGGRSPPEKVVAELSCRRNVLDPGRDRCLAVFTGI